MIVHVRHDFLGFFRCKNIALITLFRIRIIQIIYYRIKTFVAFFALKIFGNEYFQVVSGMEYCVVVDVGSSKCVKNLHDDPTLDECPVEKKEVLCLHVEFTVSLEVCIYDDINIQICNYAIN